MQASTQQPDAAPEAKAAPAPAAPAAPTVTLTGPDGKAQVLTVPQTRAELRALDAQRDELASQLTSVSDRRDGLASELRNTADEVARSGLQDRIRVLDQRILQIENDLALKGRLIASAPVGLAAGSEQRPPSGGGDDFGEGVAAGMFPTFFAMLALMLILRRRRRKREKKPVQIQATDSSQRLERLEHGMEAIAIEIERVAEGQRFVTKLLSETASPVGVSHRIGETVRAEAQRDVTR
jgi:hypothetical protein